MGIYKLPKSQWTKDGRKYKFYWNEKDETGKWHKKFSQAYKTKLDAMNAERDFLNDKVEFGGDIEMTFGEVIDQFIEFKKNIVHGHRGLSVCRVKIQARVIHASPCLSETGTR